MTGTPHIPDFLFYVASLLTRREAAQQRCSDDYQDRASISSGNPKRIWQRRYFIYDFSKPHFMSLSQKSMPPLLVPADCGTIHLRTSCTTHQADLSCRIPGEILDAL
jgi:hypothetical protein